MEYGGDKYPKEPAVRQRQLRYVRAGKWIPPTSWQRMRARAAQRRSRDGQEKRRLLAGTRSLPVASSLISLLSQVPVMMESQKDAGSRRGSISLPWEPAETAFVATSYKYTFLSTDHVGLPVVPAKLLPRPPFQSWSMQRRVYITLLMVHMEPYFVHICEKINNFHKDKSLNK